MPNRLQKLSLLCACALVGSSAAFAQHGGTIGQFYSPPIKITTNPAALPVGGKVSVMASVYNKPNTGPNAPGLMLRVVGADAGGNWPATGGTIYPAGFPNAAQPIGSQNWAHWSNATFDGVAVPSVPANHTIAMIVQYVEWNKILKHYVHMQSAVNEGAAIFRLKCNKIHVCSWVQG